jgi:hypothetical protein
MADGLWPFLFFIAVEQAPPSAMASQLGLLWPANSNTSANLRPIPQEDSAWDAYIDIYIYIAKETETRQGEVGLLRYSPYGPPLII